MIDKKICSKPLTSIRSKIDGNEYKYFSTLMEEIKWSVHKTIASFSSKWIFFGNFSLVNKIKTLKYLFNSINLVTV